MRRKDRQVTELSEMLSIVESCDVVRLGLADGDFPYIVPVCFAYEVAEGKLALYFHGAMAGRKYELLRQNPLCSFEMDCDHRLELIPSAGDATMRYRSVMGRARAEFLEGAEKKRAMDLMMARDPLTRDFPYRPAALEHTAVVRLTVLEWEGKRNLPQR